MQTVILCGGLATRLGDIAKNVPKSMVEINGKPFLEYQIEHLKKQSITDIVLCVGHLSKKIIDYFGDGSNFGINVRYSYDGKIRRGPIGALKNAESLLNDIFFVLYGDSYVFVDLTSVYQYFLKQKKLALMTIYKNYNKYDNSNVVVKNGRVIKYDKEKTKDMIYIDYGMSLFRKKTLELIPQDKFFTTKDLFSFLIDIEELSAFEVKKRFYTIGTSKNLEEFRRYILINK